MQVIILTALIVVLPLAIAGFISMWREHQDKKPADGREATNFSDIRR